MTVFPSRLIGRFEGTKLRYDKYLALEFETCTSVYERSADGTKVVEHIASCKF